MVKKMFTNVIHQIQNTLIDPIDIDSTFQATNPLTISWVSFPLVIEPIYNLTIFDFVECLVQINPSKVQTIENLCQILANKI